MSTDCRCDREGFPLASFREDDLFCTQCGGKVAWLRSRNEMPNPAPDRIRNPGRLLWVYAAELGGDDHRFTLPLDFHSLNENRVEKQRRLVFYPELCKVVPHDWPYNFQLEILDGDEPHKVKLRLKPDEALIEGYGESDWWVDDGLMPAGGVYCTLTLVGNCGRQVFSLLVCGEPRYRIEVSENGQAVLDSPPDDASEDVRQAWAISRRGRHDLSIAIHCDKGFLHLASLGEEGLDQSVLVSAPDASFEIRKSLPPDRILGPGHPPCEIIASFDSTEWVQGRLLNLNVALSPDILRSDLLRIPLYLEPRGDVAFLPRSELRIPTMYYGEVETSRPEDDLKFFFPHIKVSNRGERTLGILRPYVEARDLPGLGWITVNWVPTGSPIPDPLDLEVDKTFELAVTINLIGVNPANHQARKSLNATIFVESPEDDRPPWSLPVVVQSVGPRPELEFPLAIDFGNSNTFAIVGGPGGFAAVLGENDPENFPTAMYLTEIRDGDLSGVVIGREALELGKVNPGAMIRWLLKRWLLADEEEWETPWPVFPPKGQPREMRRADLIRLYLERILFECEAALRQTVTRAGFSYPANFSPAARRRFDAVIADLEASRKQKYPALKDRIKFERTATLDSSPDEASAVAIGFAHDPARYTEEIESHLKSSRTFLLASFDFGGGSIDSALLRFTASGGSRIQRFKSEHLSLGGDERFGGDNVTTSVCRILLERFATLLAGTHPELEFAVSEGTEGRAVGTDRWNNFQYLRVIGEELKRHLCRADPEAGPSPSQVPERLSAAITEFLNRVKVQVRLSKQFIPLPDSSSLRVPFGKALIAITLPEVYNYRIVPPAKDGPAYTVFDRVKKCIDELSDFVRKARSKQAEGEGGGELAAPEPLFIVLAGAACRLPLVPELLKGRFEGAVVVGDPSKDPDARPKSKVAYGLARYLDYLTHSGSRLQGLSRAGHYTHGPIVWRGGAIETFEWVPSCFPLRSETWHVLHGIALGDCLHEGRIDVYHQAHRPELIGTFDLSVPATDPAQSRSRMLPPTIDYSVESEVYLKVEGSEDRLRLMVRYGRDEFGNWREFGDWLLTPAGGKQA